ncbi:MAG: hypothetical protein HY569_01610 [Candidatus Magasanikbacteria bacterium]|nr:hypothetical protein [Candidatus Magasanikbacteria bacterium]
MTPATVSVMLDALVRLQMCMQPDAATGAPEDIPVIVLDPPSDASSPTEAAVPEQPVASPPALSPPSASYFLRVNQTFVTEKEAIDYADRVLSERGADECWIGAIGAGDSRRFTLLVGPFQTQSETARVQTRLTRAKIRTLFVNDGYLRRFRSVAPVPSPQQPAVSSIALAVIQPAKPQGPAAFPPWPTCSHCLFL